MQCRFRGDGRLVVGCTPVLHPEPRRPSTAPGHHPWGGPLWNETIEIKALPYLGS